VLQRRRTTPSAAELKLLAELGLLLGLMLGADLLLLT
jgi:hypothetical protein